MSSAARIAVVGAGGVGSYFAARAALAGAQVTLCLRRPRPGLVVRSAGEQLRPDLRAITDPADAPEVDWVFLATKAHQTPGVAPWLAALDRPGTRLVVMQNGVRLGERVAGLWSGAVLPAVVMCAVEMVAPGVVQHHSLGWCTVPSGPDGSSLAEVFGPEQREIRLTDDIARASWQKLVSNCAGNSLTTLTLRRAEVLREPGVADIARALMGECVAVAAAEGVQLPDGIAEAVLSGLQALPDGTGSSMLYDRLAGRELEHEVLVGAVAAIGAEHGVPTPTSTAVVALLRAVSGRELPG